ncbi:ABC transporter permease subunit [Actinomadura kijaniata]|uniref:ABC-type transport system involved in multi-copper enzyme maturation permease subunit n=1 Tax=Actinomadura namibiensis TaxID=182080 RepID=A0A7W3LSQ9_ACTNM|nr:ABC transporter permease subunit [Actinomadura namibiensis]MBA8953641.1 ABC-type transport system involved in multi-copper enzyme maturation permease subunit [Actinomadura namibiensis]
MSDKTPHDPTPDDAAPNGAALEDTRPSRGGLEDTEPRKPEPREPAPRELTPRASFANVLLSEWTKIRTVKSTFWTLLSGAAVVVGFSALFALAFTSSYDDLPPAERATVVPTSPMQIAFYFGMVIFGVLGVLVITGEYATGMIRTALTAMPRRPEYLLAKAVVLALVVLVAGLVVSFLSFFVSQAVLSAKNLDGSLGDEGVLRAVIGGGLYLTLIALLALGVGVILRHTSGSVVTVFLVLFVLGIVGGFLPGEWGATIAKYLPSNAGGAILLPRAEEGSLEPWTGLGLFALYALVVLVVALVLFQSRDA